MKRNKEGMPKKCCLTINHIWWELDGDTIGSINRKLSAKEDPDLHLAEEDLGSVADYLCDLDEAAFCEMVLEAYLEAKGLPPQCLHLTGNDMRAPIVQVDQVFRDLLRSMKYKGVDLMDVRQVLHKIDFLYDWLMVNCVGDDRELAEDSGVLVQLENYDWAEAESEHNRIVQAAQEED